MKKTAIPAYGETSADAVRKLREEGRDLTWRARIFLAIHYLQPVTRWQVTEFFRMEGGTGAVRHSTITGRITELMDDGLVQCVGETTDPETHDRVELLGIGKDNRLKFKRHNAMRYPDEVAQAEANAYMRGMLRGMLLAIGLTFTGLLLGALLALLT